MNLSLILTSLAVALPLAAAPVSFTQTKRAVDTWDFVEVAIHVANPPPGNPFTEAEVTGECAPAAADSSTPTVARRVDGFCDSEDGSLFRIRFMPMAPGEHRYSITYKRGGVEQRHTGSFTARRGSRQGMVRVDAEHPFHFVWSGTGAHYFYNSTTAYWLLGWREDAVIRASIDRLAKLKVNRLRVALNGRTTGGARWKEDAIKPDDQFQFRLEPWPAARPLDIENPGYDVTRFHLEFFRKCERMLRHARDRGMVVSLIFHLDGRDKGVDPFGHGGMGGADEQRYYRYVIARCAAFENVMWDVTNEWHLFRNESWVEQMGAFVRECDPYDHVTSVHGKGTFPFRASPWADYAMFQSWDEHGSYAFMLKNRQEQVKAGKPMPQVNEEYGYEDHYPYPWGEGRKSPARAADNRRRLAWEMTMAGGYQTTGERANIAGQGGWITGRGNRDMVMLQGYAHLHDFFTGVPWWKTEPRGDLADSGALCLAKPGELYIAYLPKGGATALKLEPGRYRARWFNPRTGKFTSLGAVEGPQWKSPAAPDAEDWALLIQTR